MHSICAFFLDIQLQLAASAVCAPFLVFPFCTVPHSLTAIVLPSEIFTWVESRVSIDVVFNDEVVMMSREARFYACIIQKSHYLHLTGVAAYGPALLRFFRNAISWNLVHIFSSKCRAMVGPLLPGALHAAPSQNDGLLWVVP